MITREAYIHQIGMVTPVGMGSAQTAASVRAGINRFAETSVQNQHREPVVMALLPDDALPPLDHALASHELTIRQIRMIKLGGIALQEAAADVTELNQIPLFVGLPQAHGNSPAPGGDEFVRHLKAQSGLEFNLADSEVFELGRAAGLVALAHAIEALSSGRLERVLVGGVDTYFDQDYLAFLDNEGRLLGEHVMDGFLPGEAACFVLLGLSNLPDGGAIAKIIGTSLGVEVGHRYSQEVYRGDGLASVVKLLFANEKENAAESTVVQTVFAGLNGENYHAKEWGVAFTRNNKHFDEDLVVEHPVDCIGDSGAALGPVMLGLAAIGMSKGYLTPSCMVWCSSDYETCSAALMTATN